MSNKDLYFKGQQENESLVCFMRYHWISLIRELISFIIFIVIAGLFFLNINQIKNIMTEGGGMEFLFIILYLAGTIFIHRFFIKIFNHFLNIRIITDRRIIDNNKTLFFRDSIDSIDLAQIQDIEKVGDGLLPSILGYGDIKIYLSASSTIKTLHCVPNAKFHFRCLSREKEARQQMLREHGQIFQHQTEEIKTPVNSKSEEKKIYYSR